MNIPFFANLGVVYGRGPQARQTTFIDAGRYQEMSGPSALRTAYGHVEPTVVGFLAGVLRLMRDPCFVAAAQVTLQSQGITLRDYLFRQLLAGDLIAVFGDMASAEHVRLANQQAQREAIGPGRVPPWYAEMYGARGFTCNSPQRRRAIQLALAATIADAHLYYGLLPEGSRQTYCAELRHTLGWAWGVTDTPLQLRKLANAANTYEQLPLMGTDELRESGTHTLVMQLFDSRVDDNDTDIRLSAWLPGVTAYGLLSDLAAFGFDPRPSLHTEREHRQDYRQVLAQDPTNQQSMFALALRCQTNPPPS